MYKEELIEKIVLLQAEEDETTEFKFGYNKALLDVINMLQNE